MDVDWIGDRRTRDAGPVRGRKRYVVGGVRHVRRERETQARARATLRHPVHGSRYAPGIGVEVVRAGHAERDRRSRLGLGGHLAGIDRRRGTGVGDGHGGCHRFGLIILIAAVTGLDRVAADGQAGGGDTYGLQARLADDVAVNRSVVAVAGGVRDGRGGPGEIVGGHKAILGAIRRRAVVKVADGLRRQGRRDNLHVVQQAVEGRLAVQAAQIVAALVRRRDQRVRRRSEQHPVQVERGRRTVISHGDLVPIGVADRRAARYAAAADARQREGVVRVDADAPTAGVSALRRNQHLRPVVEGRQLDPGREGKAAHVHVGNRDIAVAPVELQGRVVARRGLGLADARPVRQEFHAPRGVGGQRGGDGRGLTVSEVGRNGEADAGRRVAHGLGNGGGGATAEVGVALVDRGNVVLAGSQRRGREGGLAAAVERRRGEIDAAVEEFDDARRHAGSRYGCRERDRLSERGIHRGAGQNGRRASLHQFLHVRHTRRKS